LKNIHKIFKIIKGRKCYISPLEKDCLAEKWAVPFSDRGINGLDFTVACRQLCREQGYSSSLVLCMLQNRTLHLMLSCKGYFLDSLKTEISSDSKYVVLATSGLKPIDGWTIHARLV